MVLLHPSSLADMMVTAVAAGQFGTLAAALTKAKLVDALKDDGPFHGDSHQRMKLSQQPWKRSASLQKNFLLAGVLADSDSG